MNKLKVINALIEEAQYEQVRKLAFVRRVSFAKVLRQIIEDYFKSSKK
jgi:hypothetical protein